ncbi:MAG TPA: nucleotidyltransferase domain-containing protein [Caulobacteraceae bacterium]|nr:nucleotidyltransferase domain-containing protein [Caulobacteraceae bacterium]
MPKSKDAHAGSRRPTPYPELNALLERLVNGARAALGDNFVGAYLHGSFALGDADERSDVDFVIVTRQDLSPDALAALQALHAELHQLPNHWAMRLEGSYAPAAIIRRRSPEPRDPPGEPRPDNWTDPGASGLHPEVYPFWFIGNGRDKLVRSEHDNREIPRWILRERGVVLAGPNPRGLIEPVTAEMVRAEAQALIEIFAKLAVEGDLLKTHLFQCFAALAAARALHTIDTGRVNSKAAAVTFAKHRLEARFAALVERGWTEREERPARDADMGAYVERPADPDAAAATLELLRYAQHEAARLAEARALVERRIAAQRHGPADAHTWSGERGRGGAPRRGGWSPSVTRPGGRGRRG